MPKRDILKKLLAFSLALTIILSSVAVCFADGMVGMFDSGINFSCKAFYMENLDSGTVVIDEHSKEKLFPASVTKVMTALLVAEAIERGDLTLDTEITAVYADFNDMAADGSTAAISRGETMTIEQLIFCTMVSSANEACNILARAVSEDIPSFVALMNQRARELGCKNTSYMNTHGLHNESHYTCAYDVSLIFKEAIKHEILRTAMHTESYTFSTNKRESYTVRTTDYLLDDSRSTITDGYKYEYEYLLGGKTGFTTPAGACLVSYAQRDGKTYMCVALGGTRESKYDTNYAMKDTKEAYIWAFANLSERSLVDPTLKVAEIPVSLSFDSEYVFAVPSGEITALMPNDFDISMLLPPNGSAKVNLPTSLTAPIEKGQVIGSMDIVFGGETIGTVDLVADRGVEKSMTLGIVDTLEKFIGTWWFWAIIGGLAGLLVIYILITLIINTRRRRSHKRNSTAYRRNSNPKYTRGRRYK